MRETLKPYVIDFEGVRCLDFGCGLLQWQTIMLNSLGAKVTGVDMEYIRTDRRLDKYLQIWKTNTPERAIKTAFWDYMYRRRYLEALEDCSPFTLKMDNLDFRQLTSQALPFENDTFDLVVSHEVFEHIPDVWAAAREVKRVLKPGGLLYANVHLFPSISGGHHVEWKYPDETPSQHVPPWDHLRGKKFPDHPSWINELRERDYKPIFEGMFELLCWEPSVYEGVHLLTKEIRAELTDYSEDELLKKGVILVARKAAQQCF
ncbi:class I SAM-dependent methyltransferase [Desulfogranum japonicum]|uniref:class I SAM-dependent methyltransferase n=1 Tax=Desulfogranum japonicum TaxID=231447 RepID=UPI0013790F04|nr:class I SAM-dependent methyltransferase [Desulfogranum japonicum]